MASDYYSPEEMAAKFKKRKVKAKKEATRKVVAETITGPPPESASSSFRAMDTSDPADAETKSALASLAAATSVPKREPMEATNELDLKGGDGSGEMVDAMLEEEEGVRRELELQLQKARRLKLLVAQPPKLLEEPTLPEPEQKPSAPPPTSNDAEPEDNEAGLVFSSTTEFLKQLGSRTMSMLRGGVEAQESAVPRQFRNRRVSGDDMEVDEEAPVAPPQATGPASDSEAEQSGEEESKSKKRWKGLGEDKDKAQAKSTRKKGASDKKADVGDEAASTEERAVEPETNLNRGGVAAALMYASKKGYIRTEEAKSVAEPPPRKQIEEILSKDFLVEDKKFDDIDAKFFKREERERFSRARLSDFPEKSGYNPDVVLEYVDDFGARLDSKEAFSELSYKFHGKQCGKGKVDKILRKRKLDLLSQKMPDGDTPLGTAQRLRRKLESEQQAFLVLSNASAAAAAGTAHETRVEQRDSKAKRGTGTKVRRKKPAPKPAAD